MNIREDRKENKQKCYRKQFLKAFGNVYYYSISVYSLRNCSHIVLYGEAQCLDQQRGHYTPPDNTIGKLFSSEKKIIYLAQYIPLQTYKKNTFKFNILIIITFVMKHYICIGKPDHADSRVQRESILRQIQYIPITREKLCHRYSSREKSFETGIGHVARYSHLLSSVLFKNSTH